MYDVGSIDGPTDRWTFRFWKIGKSTVYTSIHESIPIPIQLFRPQGIQTSPHLYMDIDVYVFSSCDRPTCREREREGERERERERDCVDLLRSGWVKFLSLARASCFHGVVPPACVYGRSSTILARAGRFGPQQAEPRGERSKRHVVHDAGHRSLGRQLRTTPSVPRRARQRTSAAPPPPAVAALGRSREAWGMELRNVRLRRERSSRMQLAQLLHIQGVLACDVAATSVRLWIRVSCSGDLDAMEGSGLRPFRW